ncbi:hypothetical protein [Pedobacter panaciterrae]
MKKRLQNTLLQVSSIKRMLQNMLMRRQNTSPIRNIIRFPQCRVAPIAPVYRKPYIPAKPVAPKVRIGDRLVIQDRAEPKDMTKELQNDGLLQQTNNFKYKLDADELIINGRKQSDAVHQKYMKKYLKNRKGTITTTVNTD